MFFGAFTILTGLFALIMLFLAFRLLAPWRWVLGWLRGTVGFAFLLCAGFLVFINYDLSSYKRLTSKKPILTLSFQKLDTQEYEVSVVEIEKGHEQTFVIHGDQWQVDARIVSWKGLFNSLGVKPAYKLDRISGRYFSLEEERRKPRTVHSLDQQDAFLDVWLWIHKQDGIVPWVDTLYGSATYLPMVDGAIYQVSLANSGLVASPLNDVAKQSSHQFILN